LDSLVVYVVYSAVVVAAAMRFEPSGYEKGGGSLLKHFIELAILAIFRRNLRRVANVLSLSFKSPQILPTRLTVRGRFGEVTADISAAPIRRVTPAHGGIVSSTAPDVVGAVLLVSSS
jgi:uncharacterized protein YggT (Ycf19 family)